MNNEIMFDLETLGTRPGSVILSIGAVIFNSEEKVEDLSIYKKENSHLVFHRHISIASSIKEGFSVNGDTITWWLQQSEEARGKLVAGQKIALMNIPIVMRTLADWINSYTDAKKVLVYGNGANFDITLLESYFNKVGVQIPWRYNNIRCYRTLINSPLYSSNKRAMVEEKFSPMLTSHDALDDAIYQTLILQHAKA